LHRIVAAGDARELADAVLVHLREQGAQVARARGRQRVAPVEKRMHIDTLNACGLGRTQQRIQMRLVRVDAAV
jgi:hypothetical protein